MQLYIILRRQGWRSPADLEQAAGRSIKTADEDMPDDIRWIRSYVLEEGAGTVGTVCVYEASSPEAIRKHAKLGRPAGRRDHPRRRHRRRSAPIRWRPRPGRPRVPPQDPRRRWRGSARSGVRARRARARPRCAHVYSRRLARGRAGHELQLREHPGPDCRDPRVDARVAGPRAAVAEARDPDQGRVAAARADERAAAVARAGVASRLARAQHARREVRAEARVAAAARARRPDLEDDAAQLARRRGGAFPGLAPAGGADGRAGARRRGRHGERSHAVERLGRGTAARRRSAWTPRRTSGGARARSRPACECASLTRSSASAVRRSVRQ